MKSTGIRIQERREALELTREELAEKLATTRMTVWRVENGKKLLNTDELPKWARVLKVRAAELVA